MDYPKLRPPVTATNGPSLINPLDDWSDWNWYITGLARCLCALADGKATDAAGNEWPRPTPLQLEIYDLEWEGYEDDDDRYQRKITALGTIWTAIFQTVAREHLARFLEESDFAVEIYRKLKENLEPSLKDLKSRIQERYRILQRGPEPTCQSMEKWLHECDDVLLHCVYEEARLRIIIAGAGLGGLAAAVSCALSGHTVEVIEQAKELVEVGAGLQITPNASRLFKYWQLPNSIWQAAAEPTALTVHRYTGQILANEPSFHKNIRAKYDAPFIDLHRVDLQQALYACAKELGIAFHLNERVDSIDFDTTTVRTLAGNEYTGDLIIAADGLWSRCRECFLGKKDAPLPTGDLAYRIVLTADQISDPELRAWVENPECHFWIGPGAHAVAYSLRNGQMFNIVLLVPDNLPPGVSRQSGSVEEMRKLFEGWDPVLNRFLSYVDSVDKWKLMHHAEMESWVNNKSNLVFLGDACHPMLPYLAQGANSSLEDGAVLGQLLGHMKTKSHLPQILRLYESLRKSRGEAIVKETFKQRHDFHMPNGEEQEKRDEVFLSQLGKEIKGAFPSRWTCPEVQPWLYGYDAIKEVESAVTQHPELFAGMSASASANL
ncbi:hypothetical protein CNMCM5793_009504 [Aspergillus hiratsukae]|uniref:FAD-binding domain-containing protein n=1 Tax=Aspergillus hiratsukae TaxID=1194566 RepID=A0A8H6P8N8_9EURO|nr:hypothetical protein CNMCM5793_009504 [Aspergillus hiratsukae]